MEWPTILLLAVGVLVVGLASGMRIFLALIMMGIVIVWIVMGVGAERMFGFLVWSTLTSFPLAAIPLFVFMGEMLNRSGVSQRAYTAVAPIMNHFPGGLLHTNVVAGAIFAAASGSSIAGTVTIGTIALANMEARGYDRAISIGSVGAAGTLGILIPPSIALIIYGLLTMQSVGRLFLGGIIPGIMLTALYMGYIMVRVLINPKLAPSTAAEFQPWGRSLLKLLDAWPIFLLSILVLGSIYAGVATPTEAAGVGALVAILLAAGYRGLNWQMFKAVTLATIKTSCFTVLLYMSARVMGILLTNLGVFMELTEWVVALPVPPIGVLLAIIVTWLILGCFMSGAAAIVITVPIYFPIIVALGYDPIWFGVMCVLPHECGMLTPPVGSILYVLHSLRPDVSFWVVVKGCMQFFCIILVGIAILIIFPQLATWLPNLAFG